MHESDNIMNDTIKTATTSSSIVIVVVIKK